MAKRKKVEIKTALFNWTVLQRDRGTPRWEAILNFGIPANECDFPIHKPGDFLDVASHAQVLLENTDANFAVIGVSSPTDMQLVAFNIDLPDHEGETDKPRVEFVFVSDRLAQHQLRGELVALYVASCVGATGLSERDETIGLAMHEAFDVFMGF